MMPTSSFWRGKRVVVTGHTGFKGGWLCAWLEDLGARTFGISLPPATEPSLCTLSHIEQRIETIHADIRDARALQAAITRFAPEIVFHLAAQSLVRRAYREPIETFATNVMGTVNLLDAVRETPSVRAVVVVTSDKCYVNIDSALPYHETDSLAGAEPYSASKACAEIATAAWRQSYFSDGRHAIASARAGNVIGGGDWALDRLIPDCIAALVAGRPIEIRNPHSTRPWQHVLEPLSGYLILAQRLFNDGAAFARAWNFGPATEESCSISRIVERIIAQWGLPARMGPAVVPQPSPVMDHRLVQASTQRGTS
jgi:CDP-glucose 4,6-dehydratase